MTFSLGFSDVIGILGMIIAVSGSLGLFAMNAFMAKANQYTDRNIRAIETTFQSQLHDLEKQIIVLQTNLANRGNP